YQEFEAELGPTLTHVAIADTVQRFRNARKLHWPDGADEATKLDKLTNELAPEYGPWLAKRPALEDVGRLGRDVARRLQGMGALDDAAGALALRESSLPRFLHQAAELLGAEHRTFAGEVLKIVEEKRTALWRERVEKVNWELFDRGVEAYTWFVLEELANPAKSP